MKGGGRSSQWAWSSFCLSPLSGYSEHVCFQFPSSKPTFWDREDRLTKKGELLVKIVLAIYFHYVYLLLQISALIPREITR